MSQTITAGPYEVVLVNPPAEVIREEVYDRPAFPAIGIAYVGGYLESRLKTVPLLIDGKLERLGLDETVDRIVAAQPRVVGLSAFTHMVLTANRIAQRVRERIPDVVLVLGCHHVSFLPRRSLEEFPVFDYVVAGEGEVAFAELVTAVRTGVRNPVISGVWYRDRDGQIVEGGRGRIPDHLDQQGFAAWHLFNQDAIRRYVTSLPVMTQRGCPFSCHFCSRPYGRKVRQRSATHVVDEIQRNVDVFGIRDIRFYDETFTVNKKHVENILNELVARRIRIEWQAMVHANTIDQAIVRLMKETGCKLAGFGVESGDDEIMAAMKKGVTKEGIRAATMMFRTAGLNYATYFIIGHPGETLGSIWRSIRFAAELKAREQPFGIMVPYPGTEIWEMAVKGQNGYKKLSTNWDDYNKQIGNAVELERVSRRQMEFMQVVGELYCNVVNGRIGNLISMIIKRRAGVYSILKKLVFGRVR